MAHEEEILTIMESLKIADKHTVGDIMASKGIWNAGTSAVNNTYKALNALVDLGKLEKGNGYFRVKGCRSEYKGHAQELTKALAEILKLNHKNHILREVEIKEVGLRSDAIVLMLKGDELLCFVLEVANNETEEYLKQKVNAWVLWEDAEKKLSELFGTKVEQFDIVVKGMDGAGDFDFEEYVGFLDE
ncbi:hypothetical protein [Syntrophus aciditrophicus]|nr:hypothetical protein [Syntrophus aciditrophicus]